MAWCDAPSAPVMFHCRRPVSRPIPANVVSDPGSKPDLHIEPPDDRPAAAAQDGVRDTHLLNESMGQVTRQNDRSRVGNIDGLRIHSSFGARYDMRRRTTSGWAKHRGDEIYPSYEKKEEDQL